MMRVVVFCALFVAAFGRHLGDNGVVVRDLGPVTEPSPSELKLHIQTRDGKSKVFNLKRRDTANLDVPTFKVDDNGKVKRHVTDALESTAYLDTDNGAAFLVDSIATDSGTYKRNIYGLFADGDHEIHLEPAETEVSSRKRAVDGAVDHVMVRRKMNTGTIDKGPIMAKRQMAQTADEQPDSITISKRGAIPEYTAELLFVVDYQRYKGFKSDKEAKRYYCYVALALGLRYANIKSDFKMGISLVGLVYLDTESKSQLTASLAGSKKLIYGDQAVTNLEQWRKKNMKSLVSHDHCMLFTGFDIYGVNKTTNKNDTHVLGMANGFAVCTDDSVSIVEDWGGFACIKTAAHELGHSLGAVNHDGEHNTCNLKDQYIMSACGGVPEGDKTNPYKFSPCSIKQLQAALQDLNTRKGGNCLKNKGKSIVCKTAQKKPPGQVWNINKQCALSFGKGAKFIGGLDAEKAMCYMLRCGDPKNETNRGYVPKGALRGTTCGNKKWCFQGRCVSDKDAPEAPDECIYGDSKLKVGELTEDVTKPCPKLIASGKEKCYMYEKECCKSCGALKDKANSDCPYGDRETGCDSSGFNCNSAGYRKICCKTCKGVAKKPCEDDPNVSLELPDGTMGNCAQAVKADPDVCSMAENIKGCCKSCTS